MQGDIVYQTKVNLIGNTVDKDFELWGKLGANLLRNTLVLEIKTRTRKQSFTCMVLHVNRKGKEILKRMA